MVGLNKTRIAEPYTKNNLNYGFNKVSAYIAHYVTQSEETFRNRKCRPTDDTGTMKHSIDYDATQIHKNYNDFNNFYPKNAYAKRVRDFLLQRNCSF